MSGDASSCDELSAKVTAITGRFHALQLRAAHRASELDSCNSSADCTNGITSSNFPARFISSRGISSTFCSTRSRATRWRLLEPGGEAPDQLGRAASAGDRWPLLGEGHRHSVDGMRENLTRLPVRWHCALTGAPQPEVPGRTCLSWRPRTEEYPRTRKRNASTCCRTSLARLACSRASYAVVASDRQAS